MLKDKPDISRLPDKRLITSIETGAGPTVIFTAGIHGNEPSGVFALQDALNDIRQNCKILKGNVFAFAGNMSALKAGIRYNERDLNRIWTRDQIRLFEENGPSDSGILDIREQYDLYNEIKKTVEKHHGPFFFIDLHTTSSHTIPFITINDTMINRNFAMKFPVPIVLGIEEFLDGPLLSYINELGYVACGFEAGQHDEHISFRNQISYIYLVLHELGIIPKTEEISFHFNHLAEQTQENHEFYEICEYYNIRPGEDFKMNPGFSNFQEVPKNTLLASSDGQPVCNKCSGQIFMPLYQKQGDDGFFVIRKIDGFIIWLSSFLRRIRFDSLLTLLPGVSWASSEKDALKVNLRVARFMARDFFHLMGYRTKVRGSQYLVVRNRESMSRTDSYKGYL